MIDFSRAPEGATHYQERKGDRVFAWFKSQDGINYCRCPGFDSDWVVLINQNEMLDDYVKEIPKQQNMTIHCKTEREQMLCEQVLRMCRGDKSQHKCKLLKKWDDIKDCISILDINYEYRSKPKKELVVPWDWIPDDIEEIKVDEDGDVLALGHTVLIKLDLTDIDLPVTVKRP